MDAAAKALAKGTELDDGSIVIGDKIGQGGFGITYLAFDRKRQKDIVLKEFYPDYMVSRQTDNSLRVAPEHRANFEKSLRGFIREARIINELKRHPNVVKVYFFMEENNTAYYGMERLHGMDLRRYAEEMRRRTGHPMDALTAFRILKPIMKALEFTHESKVLHRDISPDNIFMNEVEDAHGRIEIVPKLIDFGAAYIAVDSFTQTHPNVRKNGYSPIEQTMPPEHQGTWSDVYALSATFYALIVGKPPVSAMDRANSEALPSPIQLGAAINEAANEVVMEGLAFRYAERIQTVSEFERRMARALHEGDDEGHSGARKGADTPAPDGRKKPKRAADPESEVPSYATDVSGVASKPKGGLLLGRRMAAYALDFLAYGLLGVASQHILDRAMGYSVSPMEFALLSCFWLFVLMFGVDSVLTSLPSQATGGMRLMGLRLQSIHGEEELSVGSCVLFNLVRSIPLLGVAAELTPIAGVSVLSNSPAQDGGAENGETSSKTETRTGTGARSDSVIETSERISGAGQRDGLYLVCIRGKLSGRQFPLRNGILVGRGASGQDIQIPPQDMAASGRHCVFRCEGGRWFLDDCSTNGTVVNGKRIVHERSEALRPGDKIEIGAQHFILTKK